MPWTTEQKIFIVEAYFRQKFIPAAQLQFKEGTFSVIRLRELQEQYLLG